MSDTADILIIGAGVAGLGVAAFLAPDAKVVVLEAEPQPCFHSTGRSAAIYIKSYGPPGIRAATAASEAFLSAPPEGFAEAPILSPRGLLHLDYRGDGFDGLFGDDDELQSLTGAEAAEIVPILRPEPIRGAAFETAALDIDVDLLTSGYRRLARAAGAEIVTNARVAGLTRRDGAWRVETAQGAWEAPLVVNAAGAWASGVAAMAGAAPITIQPKRRSAAMLPGPDGLDIDAWPLFEETGEAWYAAPKSGKMMVSPADADPVEAQDIQPDDMVLAEGIDRFQSRVTYQVRRVEHSWAGLRSFSPDGEPVIGFDDRAEGFFWLAGQGGYGIQTSPALSRLAAELATGAAPSLDPALFAPGRFG